MFVHEKIAVNNLSAVMLIPGRITQERREEKRNYFAEIVEASLGI